MQLENSGVKNMQIQLSSLNCIERIKDLARARNLHHLNPPIQDLPVKN